MPIIQRSADDIIIDNMVTALQAFSAEQKAMNSAVGFNVVRDMVRPPSMREMPLVCIWLESLDPQREGSSSRTVNQELARINVDCYAKGTDTNDDGLDDSAAMARLYYLKEQVKYGLYKLVSADFGLPVGAIGRKSWPSWRIFQNDLKLPESEVVAGRWSVGVEYAWSPEDITGIDLELITVDAGRWSGFYEYGEV
jgi:hypothetical protein